MKAILMDEDALVYANTEENSISITTLHKGVEMELGKVTQKKKKTWVEITLPGDQKGYIAGDTKIFSVRKASVAENSVDMLKTPEKGGALLETLVKGTTITVFGVETSGEDKWFMVRDENNKEGFIPSTAKLRVVQEATRPSATRNIITGFIFTAIGIFLVLSNHSTGNTNSMVWVSYAVIFFGLLQLGQGVVEYLKAKKQGKK
jgi:hypothetical protein